MPLSRKLLPRLGLALSAALGAVALSLTPFVEGIELKTYDLRLSGTARPAAPHEEIVLVDINDASVRRLEPVIGRWPWPRLMHAFLIDYLARAPAKLVVYDVLFPEADQRRFDVAGEEWTGARSDEALAESVARAGNVVLAADVADEGAVDASDNEAVSLDEIPAFNRPYPWDPCLESRPVLFPPIPGLARAARAIGHTMTIEDADGPVRRTVPLVTYGKRAVPSLALAVALEARKLGPETVRVSPGALTFGRHRVPLLEEQVFNYYGPPLRSCRTLIAYRGPTLDRRLVPAFKHYPFFDLYLSEEQLLAGERPLVDPLLFKDRVVLVGTTASGTYDLFTVPFGGGGMPGTEIHANIIDSFLSSRSLAPVGRATGLAIVLAGALLVALVGGFTSAWTTGAFAVLLSAAVAWGSVPLFARGTWLPLIAPLVAISLTVVGDLAWKYFIEGREKRQVKKLFSRYVARDVFDRLMNDPSRAELGGVRRRMTVLFSDVRGFTALAERGSPEALVQQLNEYFTEMVRVLFSHRGTLDKFVGDMVMALFGAPLDDENHADHAVEAAIAMCGALDRLNAHWAVEGRPTLDIGIGINTGEMVAGNIGSDTIMSYTVIGDAVNLGARLEALNKELGTRVIISESTRAALKGRYHLRALGPVMVRGKSRPVDVFEVRVSAPDGAGKDSQAQLA